MSKATREAYGEEISKLIQENPKIVVLDADLAGSTYSGKAGEVCPERFFDMGIAEANMIGVSAGAGYGGRHYQQRFLERCSSGVGGKYHAQAKKVLAARRA